MCLISKDANPLIAEKEIEVFKVIDMEGFPPYYDTLDENLKRYCYHPGSNKPEGEKEVEMYNLDYSALLVPPPPETDKYFRVGGGFLHAYTDYKSAWRSAKIEENFCAFKGHIFDSEGKFRKYRVVKMYVPVGAEYYVGSAEKDICATELIWKEEEACA